MSYGNSCGHTKTTFALHPLALEGNGCDLFEEGRGGIQLGNVTLGGEGGSRPKVCDVTFGVVKRFLIQFRQRRVLA